MTTGAPPLYAAAKTGHSDAVERLLGAGADINNASRAGMVTPLIAAARNGHVDGGGGAAAGRGAGGGRQQGMGWRATPLSIALKNGHADVARKLRAVGATFPRG